MPSTPRTRTASSIATSSRPNVFVTFRGQAKILDFGIATLTSPSGAPRHTGAVRIGSGALYGTLHYIAPEQIRGEIVDGRADLFSLGALLYEMATGARAFDGADPPDVAAAIIGGSVVPMRAWRPEIPAELERIVGRALEKHPDLRCQSAADLRADLQRLKRQVETGTLSPAAPLVAADADATSGPAPLEAGAAPALAAVTTRSRAALRKAARGRITPLWMAAAAAVIAAGVGLPAWMLRPYADATPDAAISTPPPAPSEVPPLPSLDGAGTPPPTTVWLDPPSDQVADPATAGGNPSAVPVPAVAHDRPAGRRTSRRSCRRRAPRSPRSASTNRSASCARWRRRPATRRRASRRRLSSPTCMRGRTWSTKRSPPTRRWSPAIRRTRRRPRRCPTRRRRSCGTRRADRDSEAHKLLSEIADRFPGHPFVPRALLARGEIESRRKNYRFDDVLGKPVPASLVTYRELTGIRNGGREREHALWRLGQAYERVERFDLAAQAYRDLGEGYANTHYDAWASAARIYDRRLNDPVLARAAYQRVPADVARVQGRPEIVRSAS